MKLPTRPTLIRPFPHTTPGAAPGSLRISRDAYPPKIEFYGCDDGQCTAVVDAKVDDLADLVARHQRCWINVDGLGEEATLRRLAELFHIHPLALEDVVNVHQRAKVEEYPEHLFIVLRMVWLGEEDLYTEQLSMVIRDNVILTFQERPGDCLDPVRNRLKDSRSSLRKLPLDHLAHAILDAIVDGYYPIIERFGEWIENAEDRIPHARSRAVITDIHGLRQELLFLRRCVWPLRETMNVLLRDQFRFFTHETRLHLRDTYDHTVQLMDVVDTYRELCADLRDFYYAVMSQRTNEVMKVLTIVATLFMPLSFIVGLYGMNFDTSYPLNMPELHWRYGYIYSLVLMALTAGGLIWFFARRGWLTLDEVIHDPKDLET
ncbi:MAG TPA: magnesium/cobalt transporter CorA [Caulifigura sp.]|jgi:magnesium transporter|nr:magnesium/cobalt transporter CorA [Caulifigura sp.]